MTRRVKIDALAAWAAKRTGNLDRMLAEAGSNDAALFSHSMILLDALSHLLTSLGDEPGALYAASLARLLEEKHRGARRARAKRGKR